nr:reverse transcriptase domain-containing protein [Tanacetum cinerariifolium]
MNTDHNLWKIIQNGNIKKSLRRDLKGGIIILPPTMLKQAFSKFSMSEEEGLHKGYDRFQKLLSQLNQMQAKPDNDDVNMKFLRALPPSWSQVAPLKTRGGLEYLSFDNLYNKLRSLEIDVKGRSSYGSRGTTVAPTHSTFIGAVSTNTKMVDEKVMYYAFKILEVKTEEPKAMWSRLSTILCRIVLRFCYSGTTLVTPDMICSLKHQKKVKPWLTSNQRKEVQRLEEEGTGMGSREGPSTPAQLAQTTPSLAFIKENVDMLRKMIKEHDQQAKTKATQKSSLTMIQKKTSPKAPKLEACQNDPPARPEHEAKLVPQGRVRGVCPVLLLWHDTSDSGHDMSFETSGYTLTTLMAYPPLRLEVLSFELPISLPINRWNGLQVIQDLAIEHSPQELFDPLRSLIVERRKQIRNEHLRTELEYFNEEYDKEREMEPRPIRARETTHVLCTRSSRARRQRERAVEFENAPSREGGIVKRNFEGGRPLEFIAEGTSVQYPQGGYVPQDFTHSNVPLYNGLRKKEKALEPSLPEFLSKDLPTTYKGLMEKTYTWIEAREVATNGALNDQKKGFDWSKKNLYSDKNREQKNRDMFSSTTRVSNPVIVKKANERWKLCVDFTDINKACLKDHHPLPATDQKMEDLYKFGLKCFLDAYKGYHQIHMAKGDEEKISFFTREGVFCYKRLPFGLKNAGGTYHKLIDKVFGNQMGHNLEIHIDDMIIKSNSEEDMLVDIKETFKKLRVINMKLNLKKCSFGVEEGLFFRHLITKQGIKMNRSKPQRKHKRRAISRKGKKANPRLRIAEEMKIQELAIFVDSHLVANQVKGLLKARKPIINQYLENTKEILKNFSNYSMEHVRRDQDKKVDALSKLDSMTFSKLAKEYKQEALSKKYTKVPAKCMQDYDWWYQRLQKLGPLPMAPRGARFLVVPLTTSQNRSKQSHCLPPLRKWISRGHQQRYYQENEKKTGEDSQSLVYGSEVVPIEISMETKRIQDFNVKQNEKKRREDLDILEESMDIASIMEAYYKHKLEGYYNKRIRPSTFKRGTYVLRFNSVCKAEFQGKIGPTWKGPYIVKKAYGDGAYKLDTLSGSPIDRTWNGSSFETLWGKDKAGRNPLSQAKDCLFKLLRHMDHQSLQLGRDKRHWLSHDQLNQIPPLRKNDNKTSSPK